ncbi:MAG: S9 family peptidase [Robiginitomaculum sp.]|nr:S9 family peptidase [Robiginitomaculum sp.]
MRLFIACILALLVITSPAMADENLLPIEAFAKQQQISNLQISPNGKMLAFINRQHDQPVLTIKNNSGEVIRIVGVGEFKPRRVIWAGNKDVLITGSFTGRGAHHSSEYRANEHYRVLSYNIASEKTVILLKRSKGNRLRHRIDLGRVLAVDHQLPAAFMPILGNILRVNLENGRGVVVRRGVSSINSWVVDAQNNAIAREIHRQQSDEFIIQVREGNKWRELYKEKTAIKSFSMVGLNMAQTALVIKFNSSKAPYQSLYEMDLKTGNISGPVFQVDDFDISGVVRDPYSNLVIGAAWVNDMREYHWFDPQLASIYTQLKRSIPGHAIRLVSWPKDRSQFVVGYAKLGHPEQFAIYQPKTHKFEHQATSRPQLDQTRLGQVKSFKYAARDGLEIPAYLTLPVGAKNKNLPMIVLPHGGPQSRDNAHFNWLAQLLASRGYVVFQPNFRGSSGYGWKFTAAGWGEWGKAMQHDITDGVKYLIDQGVVDPKRICIVGSSYGGYAALAGGAFTPELYKCVVSIAGVSDLNSMYKWTWKEYGKEHWVVKYWGRSMSGKEERRETMKNASPARFAKQFQAPVLLIHGEDDTVVHIEQSKKMLSALKRAKVDVRLITQKNGDHWMSYQETRIETATEVLAFLDKHLKQKSGQ